MLIPSLLAAAIALTGIDRDIRPLLYAQGFQWTLEKAHSDIEYIGDIQQGSQTYSIYLYNAVNRENLHGINRFIIILNRTTYLGVYESGSAHDCRIEAETVICKADYPGRRIQFTKNGPPLMLWFDGYYERLWFAPKFKQLNPGDER